VVLTRTPSDQSDFCVSVHIDCAKSGVENTSNPKATNETFKGGFLKLKSGGFLRVKNRGDLSLRKTQRSANLEHIIFS